MDTLAKLLSILRDLLGDGLREILWGTDQDHGGSLRIILSTEPCRRTASLEQGGGKRSDRRTAQPSAITNSLLADGAGVKPAAAADCDTVACGTVSRSSAGQLARPGFPNKVEPESMTPIQLASLAIPVC
jgi:hypothetical protein